MHRLLACYKWHVTLNHLFNCGMNEHTHKHTNIQDYCMFAHPGASFIILGKLLLCTLTKGEMWPSWCMLYSYSVGYSRQSAYYSMHIGYIFIHGSKYRAPITVIQLWHVISDRGMCRRFKMTEECQSDHFRQTLGHSVLGISSLGVGLRSEWRTRGEGARDHVWGIGT